MHEHTVSYIPVPPDNMPGRIGMCSCGLTGYKDRKDRGLVRWLDDYEESRQRLIRSINGKGPSRLRVVYLPVHSLAAAREVMEVGVPKGTEVFSCNAMKAMDAYPVGFLVLLQVSEEEIGNDLACETFELKSRLPADRVVRVIRYRCEEEVRFPGREEAVARSRSARSRWESALTVVETAIRPCIRGRES